MIKSNDLLDALASHASALGCFERVNKFEPKNPPGNGITASIWFVSSVPVTTSGLNSTSVVQVWNVRLQSSMLMEPQDMIDPNLIDAMDLLMEAYNGDFTLGGLVRQIDIFGAAGQPLAAQGAYLDHSSQHYRVIDILVPCLINDQYGQEA